MSGAKLFALYSYPPQRFGLCGKRESGGDLLKFIFGKRKKIFKILKNFEGVFSYLSLIAKENKILNPLEKKVVRAYWIGNELLERVKVSEMEKMIKKKSKKKLPKKLPLLSRAHHSFHVLTVGSFKKELILTEGMKDLCRISWGKVLKILNSELYLSNLIVEYQPLFKRKRWYLGKLEKRKIFWDKRILPKIKKGDFISFHWDFALEILSKNDLKNLLKYTKLSMRVANLLKL